MEFCLGHLDRRFVNFRWRGSRYPVSPTRDLETGPPQDETVPCLRHCWRSEMNPSSMAAGYKDYLLPFRAFFLPSMLNTWSCSVSLSLSSAFGGSHRSLCSSLSPLSFPMTAGTSAKALFNRARQTGSKIDADTVNDEEVKKELQEGTKRNYHRALDLWHQ